jgi:hypothetical protein
VELRNILAVEVWAHPCTKSRGKESVHALLDSGATADCISETFRELIGAEITQQYTGASLAVQGSPIHVLGYVELGIRWTQKPFGTSMSLKRKFCVVQDLQMDMLIGAETVEYYRLRESAMDFIAPILLSKQTKKPKTEDERRHQQLKTAGQTEALRDAAQRKADRLSLNSILEKESSTVSGSETSRSRSSTPNTVAGASSSSETSQSSQTT